MCTQCNDENHGMPRREFIRTMGFFAAGVSLGTAGLIYSPSGNVSWPVDKKPVVIRGAFLYPPSKTLNEEGYYSWPGSDFDAEGRQAKYMFRLRDIGNKLGIRIDMDQKPLDTESDVAGFISRIKSEQPDGLLLIPFKKLPHWDHVVRITEETRIPSVILATLGVLQGSHVRQVIDRPGIYMINSPDNLDAVENGLGMIAAMCWLRNATIVNINGDKVSEKNVPFFGTKVRTIPHQRFYDLFARTKADEEVTELAKKFTSSTVKIVQPSNEEILDAAKTYFILKKLIEEEKGDALMMNCLAGLRKPRKHVPPCMGFMSLLDEGISMGCEADLDGTLTMMLLQKLTGKPGFLHNSALDTEKNQYWGAHCTAPSRMNGKDAPPESYELMSHCESGWGTVPRVLFKEGQEITLTRYLSFPPESISAPTVEAKAQRGPKPPLEIQQLLLYSGTIICCPPIPPAGGCRSNVQIKINELDRVTDLIGNHMVMVYGNHVKMLKHFCQLYDLKVSV